MRIRGMLGWWSRVKSYGGVMRDVRFDPGVFLRDCISYYDREGAARPGALVYYGGGRWHKYRLTGQEALDP